MSVYYDRKTKEFYHLDDKSTIPEGYREIKLDALHFYNEFKNYYQINLDNTTGIITLDRIKAVGVDIEHLRTVRLNEVNTACRDAICAGIDVETSLGVKHFSLTSEDYMEILDLRAQDLPEYSYHADGEPYLLWKRDEFMKIANALLEHKNYHRRYCNRLRTRIKHMKCDVLWDTVYGMELLEE